MQRDLADMEQHGFITAAEAMDSIGCYRLAARIADLRKAGHFITSEMTTGRNRKGQSVSFAVYRLVHRAKEKERETRC